MSFLQIAPDELAAAATQLGTLGASMAAQNAAAAASTTALAPAAADEVSALQAALFASYGTYYQQISAEAQAMFDTFVNTLGNSAGTYSVTEDLNSSATALSFAGDASDIQSAVDSAIGSIPDFLSGGLANIVNIGAGNWASACSNLLGLAGGGLLPAEETAEADTTLGAEAGLGALGAANAALGELPIAAGVNEAASIGTLSASPTWAGPATLVSSTTTDALQDTGWITVAPQAAPGTILPGVPGLASAVRNSAGFGAPRYGVKPIVMPKPVSI